ncbi:calcium-binding protein [Halovulum sp. GXIMD14794]
MNGFSGRDDIRAGGGDDIVIAGPGRDGFVAGGPGNDLLIGGPGNDFMAGSDDDDRLVGGSGDDGLFNDAGDDAAIGGGGDDWLATSYGNDLLTGGGGADTFSFNTVLDTQSETVTDFDGSEDILNFRMVFDDVPDNGAVGLADDIDAVSTITDTGPGGDVILEMDAGTTIVFKNAGTGSVDSVADLVDDPLTQITSDVFDWA